MAEPGVLILSLDDVKRFDAAVQLATQISGTAPRGIETRGVAIVRGIERLSEYGVDVRLDAAATEYFARVRDYKLS